ncbi:hypothetical protein DID88_007834 [Monilinia fructigena]|uniref:Major facilitator superfamily (MFS) profile domain-containing protein n=1 Tax=Monilinia fructigena TaxID=38457 RepID=A0A395J4L3_9HELO|nr:hypothetical protein DID88_007834 [Monilinia fructigena]
MVHSSSSLPLGKKYQGSDAEFKSHFSVSPQDFPLFNESTQDLEEGMGDSANTEGGNIPKADESRDAWLFLAACFVFEALIWGFPFAFGVFQTYYSTHPPFDKHANSIAITGTCATGIMYLFAPVSLYVLETFPPIRRLSSIVGLAIVLVALVAASFATEVWHLVVTQGVLYAVGGSLLYSPTMFYLDQWFCASLSFSSIVGTTLIALLNSFSVIGAISLGYLSDIRHITTVVLISSALSALSVFFLWGISTSLPSLIFFTIIYGIFAGGWSAIWAGMIREVQLADENAGFGILMGLFSAGRGVGSVVCGPVTEWLVQYGGWDGVNGGYGTEYGTVIFFTGELASD